MGWERVNERIYGAGEGLCLLDARVRGFIDSVQPDAPCGEKDGDALIFKVTPQNPPHDLVVLAGEIASDLWAAVVEAVAIASAEDVADLPVTDTPQDFVAWMNAHLPEVWLEEGAVSEGAQPDEGADWLSDLRRIAQHYARGNLEGTVELQGNIRRSRGVPEADADPTEHPPVAHAFRPGSPLAEPTFNVHMHVALCAQVIVGTPGNVVSFLEIAHAEVRALVDKLNSG